MYLPTYGYIGSSGVTGAVSRHLTALICRSWLTTTLRSLVTWVSSSRVDTPSRSALPNPSRDSSVVMPRPPRWAWRSKCAFRSGSWRPTYAAAGTATETVSNAADARPARTCLADIDTSLVGERDTRRR